MNIRNGFAASIYRLLVAILAMLGAWMCFENFGWSSWRVLLTYTLLFTTIYFGVLAIVGLVLNKRKRQALGLPMLEGALIITLLTVSVTTFVFMARDWEHPALAGGAAALSYVTLPVLVIADWLIFMPKGRWRSIYPFYWLAFPVFYVAAILFTAELYPNIDLRYPLAFLDYHIHDIVQMIWILIFYAICILIVGYGFYAIDALVGGKVGKYVVLPKIKLVEVGEVGDHEERTMTKGSSSGSKDKSAKNMPVDKIESKKRRPKAPQVAKND